MKAKLILLKKKDRDIKLSANSVKPVIMERGSYGKLEFYVNGGPVRKQYKLIFDNVDIESTQKLRRVTTSMFAFVLRDLFLIWKFRNKRIERFMIKNLFAIYKGCQGIGLSKESNMDYFLNLILDSYEDVFTIHQFMDSDCGFPKNLNKKLFNEILTKFLNKLKNKVSDEEKVILLLEDFNFLIY